MTLPSHGWKGYGRPGYIPVSLRPHFTTEARQKCMSDTLLGEAVNRWVREIGERA